MATNSKTTRNLSQFAEKKLVGRAHTRADRSDVSEGIPSNIQITTNTIFGQPVPSSPSDNAGSIALWDVDSNNRVQKVELDVTVISGTSYDADSSADKGGGDTPQSTGPHAYSLSLPADYETKSGNNNPKKGTGVFVNDKRLYDTLGGLQIVPTNLFIDPTFVTPNPYDQKIYYENNSGTTLGYFGPTDNIDWFIDPYAGIVFLQEYDANKIPNKVECFIYIGDMADSTTGGTTTLAGCTDTAISGPSNGQALVYNSATSKWEPQNQSASTTLVNLTDTDISGPSNNQVLTYNSSSSKWEAQDSSTGTTTLDGLTDVNAGSPSNNQVLTWDNSSSKWIPQNSSGGGGIERYSYVRSGSTISADTDITISGMDFTGLSPSNADTKLYLNGQLLVGGSVSDVTSDSVDYAFNNNTDVRFSFDIMDGDAIWVYYTTTSFSTGKDILLHTDDTAFDSARVITAGDGISISTSTPRQLIINNTGLIERSKTHVTSATTYGTNDVFTMAGVDFSSKSYSDDRIDIFLQGVLLIKGIDYELADVETSLGTNEFKLKGSTSISSSDIVSAILF